ncbi:hypothetical protein B7P43_G14876, partial [Cryptotermes secundus]
FYGEELLAPHPTPKLEGHPLSAVRDCEGVSSIRNLRTRHAVVTRSQPNMALAIKKKDGSHGNGL